MKLKTVVTSLAILVVSLAATGSIAAPKKAKGANSEATVLLKVRALSATSITCTTDCEVYVDVYAPNTYTEPGESTPVASCAAVVRNSPIIIPKGTHGQTVKWTIQKKDGADSNTYKFDTTGIDMETWPRERYRNRRLFDFWKPYRESDASFHWIARNLLRRDDATCHDPAFDDTLSTPGRKCEIAYVPVILMNDETFCPAFDPTILNGGQ